MFLHSGIDLGYRIVGIGKHHIQVLGSVAINVFDALNEKDETGDTVRTTIRSVNGNVGVGYKFILNDANSIGIEAKYNVVEFHNPKGTDLTGNIFTLNFIYTLGTPPATVQISRM